MKRGLARMSAFEWVLYKLLRPLWVGSTRSMRTKQVLHGRSHLSTLNAWSVAYIGHRSLSSTDDR